MTTNTTPKADFFLTEEAFGQLRADLQGQLLLPADEDSDSARKVWNGMIDKRPAFSKM